MNADQIAVVGLFLTGIGSLAAALQVGLSRRVERLTFLLQHRESTQRYNALALKLQDTAWVPKTPKEWFRLKRYMGHMESICDLVEDGIINIEDADEKYSHRFLDIVSNKVIYEKELVEYRLAWTKFLRLVESLKTQRVYRSLDEKRLNGASSSAA